MKKIQGNLLDFPNGINMIFHSANTENIMGAGIARQIRERYPQAYKADSDLFIPKGRKRLGYYSQALVSGDSEDCKLVVNLYSQRLGEDSVWGCPTNYFALRDALRSCLHDRITFSGHYDEPICGFPFGMGCGLGGGDWKIVEYIIRETLQEFDLEGFIITY
jgi:O-acetyl-ADP-ribose deacetylase (regulator of RNase III)